MQFLFYFFSSLIVKPSSIFWDSHFHHFHFVCSLSLTFYQKIVASIQEFRIPSFHFLDAFRRDRQQSFLFFILFLILLIQMLNSFFFFCFPIQISQMNSLVYNIKDKSNRMGKGRPQKYNRVSCQQKFMLRRLITKEKMSVKQAAETLGINYSTAKTIMFCYRQVASDLHSNFTSLYNSSSEPVMVTYSELKTTKRIQILSSIGGSDWMKNQFGAHESTDQQKQVKHQDSF